MDENIVSLGRPSSPEAAPPFRETADRTLKVAHGPKLLKLPVLAAVGLLAVATATYTFHHYWTVGRFNVSTDDAYIKADSSSVAPKISGQLVTVTVADNQVVKAGDVLAVIDDADYQTALEQARADVDAATGLVQAKLAAIEAQQSVISAAKATVEIDKANQAFAERNDRRYARLAVSGYAPLQTAEQAAAQIAAIVATTTRDISNLEGATRQVDLLKAELAQAEAALARSIAFRRQAELNLSYTSVKAPISGVVGNRTLRSGQYVQAGTQLLTIVPVEEVYIVANYKETQLTDVRPGQIVDIQVDTYPGRIYRGTVASIAPASGQEFALLPPDNATGNFTKVVQRIPVKIVLDEIETSSGELRPGMSVVPSINTKDASRS